MFGGLRLVRTQDVTSDSRQQPVLPQTLHTMTTSDDTAETWRDLAVDTRAWEFLIDSSKVSFDAMAVFTSGAVATSTPSPSTQS
jgi:hypothetical protein